MKTLLIKPLLVMSLALLVSPEAHAQKDKFLRTNPKFVESFREVVARPSVSTVRILCDGKDTALGMIVGADGWVLTKANDLTGKVSCKLKDGRTFDAKVIGVQKEHDLAMLKIEAANLPAIDFAPSKALDAGSWVACAGIHDDPVAIGVVSVGTRNVINKGPTFTIDNTKAGFLGVSLEPADKGVKINRIEPKSAADKAGLKPQDLIIAIGSKKVWEVESFIQTMARKKPGDVVTLTIRRDEEEMEIKATLGKRPPGMARGDFQNKMGSELSSRRSGYPTILQHDSVVKPTDCGGPIVDLDGRVIGINICRAGRTESWAVPSEVLQAVLADLKSGKLAPPPPAPEDVQPKNEDRKKLASLEDKTRAVDALLGLLKQRLELSVDVARYKFANKMPVADGKREDRQLGKLMAVAEEAGIERSAARKFITAQFAASRKLQEELHARWAKDDKAPGSSSIPDLKKTLRPKIDQVSRELVDAFALIEPHLGEKEVQRVFRQRSAQVLRGDGISESVRDRVFEGWFAPK